MILMSSCNLWVHVCILKLNPEIFHDYIKADICIKMDDERLNYKRDLVLFKSTKWCLDGGTSWWTNHDITSSRTSCIYILWPWNRYIKNKSFNARGHTRVKYIWYCIVFIIVISSFMVRTSVATNELGAVLTK